ncbi:unnamed protein product [Moneuplotes crassus]|uniref:Uncharacterized protein n=1 Tax=Euplotes crassus TaxID=5936 RepID=A0AAD1XHI6_EUPCR|nr:unnamed protein product [Moneuplotes crassus]
MEPLEDQKSLGKSSNISYSQNQFQTCYPSVQPDQLHSCQIPEPKLCDINLTGMNQPLISQAQPTSLALSQLGFNNTTSKTPTMTADPAFTQFSAEKDPEETKHMQAKTKGERRLSNQEEVLEKEIYEKLCMSFKVSEFGRNGRFEIWLERNCDFQFIRKVENIILPKCRNVVIYDLTKSNRAVAKFLCMGIPTRGVQKLTLGADRLINIRYYLKEIIKASYRIEECIDLGHFKINGLQLQKLLRVNRHKKKVWFYNCKFSLPKVPNLSKCLQDTTIQEICLYNCEGKDRSNWLSRPEELSNLISSLSQSDIKHSLQRVCFSYDCQLPKPFITTLFQASLSKVQVHGSFKSGISHLGQ